MNDMTTQARPSEKAAIEILRCRAEYSHRNLVSEGAVALAEMLYDGEHSEDALDALSVAVGGWRQIERMIADDIVPCDAFGELFGRMTDGALTARAWHRPYLGVIPALVDPGEFRTRGIDSAVDDEPVQPDMLGALLLSVWKCAIDNHERYSNTGDSERDIQFLALGLTGEAGELANFVKKRWRDGDAHHDAIRFEIADVCAYAFMLAQRMGLSASDLLRTIAVKQDVFQRKMADTAAKASATA